MRLLTSRATLCAALLLFVGCDLQSDGPPSARQDSAAVNVSLDDTAVSPGNAASTNKQKIKSRFWARTSSENYEVITDRVILKSGTQIGWQIELEQPLSVYVLYRGPQDDVEVLFPSEANRMSEQGPHLPIPEDTELDDERGLERYYLIASAQPIEPLETRIAEFRSAPEEEREQFKKPLLDALLEVRKQHEPHQDLARTAGRPTRIGGAMRGGENQDNAVEYDIDEVFCRTFFIDHQ